MKKFSFFLLLSIIILASSCKKDDPIPQPSKEQLIVGDWSLESTSSDNGLILISLGGDTDTTTFTTQSKNENFRLELNDNKSLTASGDLTVTITTVDSLGIPKYEDIVFADSTATGTWLIDGDILKITSNGDVTDNKIIELTTNKLKYETTEISSDTTDILGIQFIVQSSSTSVSIYKK